MAGSGPASSRIPQNKESEACLSLLLSLSLCSLFVVCSFFDILHGWLAACTTTTLGFPHLSGVVWRVSIVFTAFPPHKAHDDDEGSSVCVPLSCPAQAICHLFYTPPKCSVRWKQQSPFNQDYATERRAVSAVRESGTSASQGHTEGFFVCPTLHQERRRTFSGLNAPDTSSAGPRVSSSPSSLTRTKMWVIVIVRLCLLRGAANVCLASLLLPSSGCKGVVHIHMYTFTPLPMLCAFCEWQPSPGIRASEN